MTGPQFFLVMGMGAFIASAVWLVILAGIVSRARITTERDTWRAASRYFRLKNSTVMSTSQSSRQRLWQLRQKAAGECVLCRKPAINASHCEAHAAMERARARLRYRAAHGIPADAPLIKRGRPTTHTPTP